MAYFRCISGSAGGGATITVTYDSSFYNKTITCSMGGTTYTKTTTSSGSTEFSVKDEGTWTITCNGVSRTVEVVLNYTTTMAITLPVTVYSAASDTVSFTDSVGSKTVTTNSSGVGTTNITIIPPSQTITFTSTVAKNPSNLSANYAKNVSLTANSTSVYVMPDGALYWYGYGSTSPFNTTQYWNRSINANSVSYEKTSTVDKNTLFAYDVGNTVGKNVHLVGGLLNNCSPYYGYIALQKSGANQYSYGGFEPDKTYAYFGCGMNQNTSQKEGTYYTTETPFYLSSGSTTDTPTHVTFSFGALASNTYVFRICGIWVTD